MSEKLPVPPGLEHLIEKREQADPRNEKRRGDEEQRSEDLGPLGALESAADLDDVPDDDRRESDGRRDGAGRREEARRDDDLSLPDNPPAQS